MHDGHNGSGVSSDEASHINPESQRFFDTTSTYLSLTEQHCLQEAFELARQAHRNQYRKTGELFFTHPLTVAQYLADYRLDAPALIAALLHDVAEDTVVSVDEIAERFGPEVGRLVDGVTKLKEVTAGVTKEQQLSAEQARNASMLKMFDAMTTDVRVVLIKLFDRLHNMRTIGVMSERSQRAKAKETLSIYAPLANRLGIWRLKSELEALSLQVLDNAAYHHIKLALDQQLRRRHRIYSTIMQEIVACLKENDVAVVDVTPSPESIRSIYESLDNPSAPLGVVHSPLRVVVSLQDVRSCYLALGYLHQTWRPMPGKFDDYIATPLENLYRALHTTVIYSNGDPLKIRLLDTDMRIVSDIGILANWRYAGTPTWNERLAERIDALFVNIRENIKLEQQDYRAGVQGVVEDVFRKQIMVYTPRGKMIELPEGATPVDFAYAIHTEVGNQCQIAYVNGEQYPLNKPLRNGDQIRIGKSGWARPQRNWLDRDLGFLATSRARSRVKHWFRHLPEHQALAEGKKLLQDELKMLGLSGRSHQRIAKQLGYEEAAELYHDSGRAELIPTVLATRILAQDWYQEPSRDVGNVVRTSTGQKYVITNADKQELRLCRACNARPDDKIVGFVRRGGGVTIHKEGCYSLRPDPMADRTIKLAWGIEGSQKVHRATVQIDVFDRTGLLYEISELLRDEGVNIAAVNTPSKEDDGNLRLILDLDVNSPRQLVLILHRTQALVNVRAVCCLRGKDAGAGKNSISP
jgi:guanosine-3',5'-bis(diphosphate) 3'-pyrophosphohydrolase